MKKLFSAPTTVNLELTELCNVKCRHCYNFWRDESIGHETIKNDKIDDLIAKLSDAGVFHVILTGGEPFANYPLLLGAIKSISKHKMSMSVNSNLMIVTKEKLSELRSLGLDHILTSLPSPDPKLNDFIMNQKGSLDKIISGIKMAREADIRVSVNMVITRQTKDQVFDAGKLVSDLDCQKLFVTRSVPPTYSDTSQDDNYSLTEFEQKKCLDDAIKVKNEFNIAIGTLVSYPLCFLEDLEKYSDFVGRGCPAQAGHRMSINANGNVHACVHEEESYGNLMFQSVEEIYTTRMRKWHNRSFHYKGCEGCRYIDICESGCSMTSLAINGAHETKDPLFKGFHVFKKHYNVNNKEKLKNIINDETRFVVPQRIRFRKENGFYLINARWGNTITIDTEIAEELIKFQTTQNKIRLTSSSKLSLDVLADLFFKDIIESDNLDNSKKESIQGLGFNFDSLEITA